MPERDTLVRFEEFRIDLGSGELWRRTPGGEGFEPVDLPPQAARLLTLLVRHHGALVERAELRRELWGDRWVDWEAGLHQAVCRVRSALGDDREPRRFVQTVARRGYRFVASVEPCEKMDARATKARRPSIVRAAAVAATLLSLTAAWWVWDRRPESPAADPPLTTAEARRLYLEGVHLMSEARAEPALRRLTAAAERAPAWSAPWSAIAEIRLAAPHADRVELARGAVERALSRSADDARAWRTLARLRMWEEWDWLGARSALERALEIEPGSADGWQLLAALETVERHEVAALAASSRALELDPISSARRADLGWTLYYSGHAERAIAECRRGLEIDPASATARQCLDQARLLAASQRRRPLPEDALDRVRASAERLAADPSCVGGAVTAVPRLLAGDRSGALEALTASAELGSGWDLPFALVDPLLAPLAAEPRLVAVWAALDLPG